MELTGLELKLESKDPLLGRVCHSIELVLMQPCMLGVGYFMATLTSQS
jgi:hypothetical protein